MYGPEILARTLSVAAPTGSTGRLWQYHSRSDRHSKVACWGILFDLMHTSALLRSQIAAGEIAFGINHEMRDFRMNRRKNFDLVLCTPRVGARRSGISFRSLIDKYEIQLSAAETRALKRLPEMFASEVGAVHVSLEAKACMTEHMKARPRLYDELNSSHLTIHGASEMAIAVGFAMVNIARQFRSPQKRAPNRHDQPRVTERVIEKLKELPRRSSVSEQGFDAFAIMVVDCANDGRPVTLVTEPPAPQPGDIFHYDAMIQRLAHVYEARFPRA